MGNPHWSEKEVLDSLRKAESKVEGKLTQSKYEDLGIGPSRSYLYNHFGGWNNAKNKAGIDILEKGENEKFRPPRIFTNYKGYVKCRTRIGDSNSNEYEEYEFPIHRLVAVAEYGIDKVNDSDVVHHQNGIKWDNRPSNLIPMSTSDHIKLHREAETVEDLQYS